MKSCKTYINIHANPELAYRPLNTEPTLGTRGLFLASGLDRGRRPERHHNRDLKPETAQKKPLALRVH